MTPRSGHHRRHLRPRGARRSVGGALAILSVAMVLTASACGPLSAREVGEQLFSDPRLSLSEANPVSCATCHAVSAEDTRILAGGSLVGAMSRPSYWGGFITSPLDATNVCVTRFMRGGALSAEEPRSRALYEYLRSLSPEPAAPAVPFTIVENVVTVDRADAALGAEVWQRACADCHGEPHTGAGRLDEAMVLVPEASEIFATQLGFPTELVVIEKIRHGVFFNVGGTMPPYSVEVLSDDDLAALMSYLEL